ncbi:MAG TPA: plasmid replication protein [Azospirillum sp.]|nr:plasmid replication protein [Azospirillum sp.]
MSKVTTPGALQLVLFELEDRSQSHLIALYDLAPRYVFASRDGSRSTETAPAKGNFVASIKREFAYRGSTFNLTIQPARLTRVVNKDDGSAQTDAPTEIEYEVFPAEREQVVEHVVRRLAMDRSRLSLGGENRDKVQMRFTLYEIQRELRAVGHTLSIRDIRESLTILARSRIIIGKPGDAAKKGRGHNLLESTAFPVLAIRSRPDLVGDEGGDEETHLQFNPLVSSAIRNLEFKPVSYQWLMRLKSPVSRWLYNRLSAEYEQSDSETPGDTGVKAMTLTAEEIIKNSGMNVWSRRRDTLRAVTGAVDALVEEGILDSVEKVYDKNGARIDDITYVMLPSTKFLTQVRRAQAVESANVAAMKAITGNDRRPTDFVPVTPAVALETRARRSKRLTEGSPTLLTVARTGS